MSEYNDMQAVIQAAREAGEPQTLDPLKPQAVIVPAGAMLNVPDLRAWRAAPERQSGTYRVMDVDSLVKYVNDIGLAEFATVWVDPDGMIVAVLNDHDAEGPGWSDFRVELVLKTTPEWDYWVGKDGHLMGQVEFAEHVEDGLMEIEEPASADLLEMAQTFHATSGSTFRSSVRLQSGQQQFRYEENVEAKAGRAGDLTIPTVIVLNIAPFVGEPGVLLNARFRFRLSNGNLRLGYKLERPERVKDAAIEVIRQRLVEQFEHVYLGKPRANS